ncbi:hypothetical protein M0802_008549 [Mischocyttarus mexicanus]|nr:hypothetical protein M0802_008549 [Mischocyttarus mexicanus]
MTRWWWSGGGGGSDNGGGGRPSCRRRGALRNVGAIGGATLDPVPLTIPFLLCSPLVVSSYRRFLGG